MPIISASRKTKRSKSAEILFMINDQVSRAARIMPVEDIEVVISEPLFRKWMIASCPKQEVKAKAGMKNAPIKGGTSILYFGVYGCRTKIVKSRKSFCVVRKRRKVQ